MPYIWNFEKNGNLKNITYTLGFRGFLESNVSYLVMLLSITIILSILHHMNVTYQESILTLYYDFYKLDIQS